MTDEQWTKFDKWPKGLTIDPHSRKAWFLIWWAVRPDDVLMFFEEWPPTEFYETDGAGGTAEYVKLIQGIEAGDNFHQHPIQNVVWRILDPNFGRTPMVKTGTTLQQDLSDQGYWFDTKVSDNIHERHIAVQSRLSQESIVWTPNCKNTILAMERYIHDEHRHLDPKNPSERPKEAYKDGADVVGYTVMSNPKWFEHGTDRPPDDVSPMFL